MGTSIERTDDGAHGTGDLADEDRADGVDGDGVDRADVADGDRVAHGDDATETDAERVARAADAVERWQTRGWTTVVLEQRDDGEWRATQAGVDCEGRGETAASAAAAYCRRIGGDE